MILTVSKIPFKLCKKIYPPPQSEVFHLELYFSSSFICSQDPIIAFYQ